MLKAFARVIVAVTLIHSPGWSAGALTAYKSSPAILERTYLCQAIVAPHALLFHWGKVITQNVVRWVKYPLFKGGALGSSALSMGLVLLEEGPGSEPSTRDLAIRIPLLILFGILSLRWYRNRVVRVSKLINAYP